MKPTAAAVLALLLPLAACTPDGGEAAPPAAEPTRVESAELGIAVVVPAGSSFAPAGAEGGVLRFSSPGETSAGGDLGPATLVYAAEPPQQAGVNLVAAVNERAAEIEARPNGDFLGQVGLVSQLGNAMNTRGRFLDENGQEVEEVRIFAVHPSGDRLLHMTMRYTPVDGQARARADQALEAFGWIEPLAAPPAAAETGTAAGQ